MLAQYIMWTGYQLIHVILPWLKWDSRYCLRAVFITISRSIFFVRASLTKAVVVVQSMEVFWFWGGWLHLQILSLVLRFFSCPGCELMYYSFLCRLVWSSLILYSLVRGVPNFALFCCNKPQVKSLFVCCILLCDKQHTQVPVQGRIT